MKHLNKEEGETTNIIIIEEELWIKCLKRIEGVRRIDGAGVSRRSRCGTRVGIAREYLGVCTSCLARLVLARVQGSSHCTGGDNIPCSLDGVLLDPRAANIFGEGNILSLRVRIRGVVENEDCCVCCGLGESLVDWASLLWIGRVSYVVYAFRALSATEALALTRACDRFYICIHGEHILLSTDHQPLVSILRKKKLITASLTAEIPDEADAVWRETTHCPELQSLPPTMKRDSQLVRLSPSLWHPLLRHTPQAQASDITCQELIQVVWQRWSRRPTEVPMYCRAY
ncbi:hypothetical protein PR048_018740 [Dryococelus australis]|uniref:Reverse transcriptase RNase H-like domain-containing protein n=1 Tax=Dryococelus australis TaxID=614101 RepID=A0ABQ9HD51_9NEOP|nr:hypothetical protein PR048_018740 [Dryococelus australis]